MSHESEGGGDHLDWKSTVTPAHSVGCSVGRKGTQLWTPTGCQSPEAHSPYPGFWYTLTIKVGAICLESGTSRGRSPFLHLQMGLGFSRPRTLHTSLERALLGASGHTAAYFIWQRPFSLNPSSNPTSDSSFENQFINRQFYWRLHRQAYFPAPLDDVSACLEPRSTERRSCDWLPENGRRLHSGLLLFCFFPSHSFLTQHRDLWSEWQWKLTQEKQLGRNVIQSRWGGVRLTAAMKSHFELSMCWWSNEMKTTLRMAGDSNDCVCGFFWGVIRFTLYEPEPPSRPREMNYFVIVLPMPEHLPASVPLGINSFLHKKNKLSIACKWMEKLGA